MKTLPILIAIAWFSLLANQAYASPKVTQAALVDFKSSLITVLAVEEFGKPPSLVFFRDSATGQEKIQSIDFSKDIAALDEYACVNSFLRFKTFRIKGIASPLIVAIAAQPTGTDEWVEVKLISEKDGKIVELNPVVLALTIQDGIYLGYINKKYGYGLVKWNFKWDAAHYEPHKYEISVYTWNKRNMSFMPRKTFVTRKKFKTDCAALRHYGLPCRNIRDEIIRLSEDISTLGIENELLYPESDR